LKGNLLWQYGEPGKGEDAAITTSDLAFQIYDIDGDGANEVILLRNFKIIILDGATGKVKNSVATPQMPPLTEKTCYKWPESEYGRINGDAIVVANLSGGKRPSEILVKSRYNFVWAYDSELRPLWRVKGNTGHFPQPYDFNGDGRDEIVMGWSLISSDGEVLWDLELPDHVDEIAIGAFDPNRTDVQIALVGGDDGFMIVSPKGEILRQEMVGHAQRVAAARFRADLPGLQFYVTTFWDNAGIISFHDCTGKKLWDVEPAATGNIMNPVNWTGDGIELALLSGSQKHGGLVDGYGRRVVEWPDDGHPELAAEALDLTGNARDEVVLWYSDRMNIYTQDTDASAQTIYKPRRYPHYNNSNYRAEISLPDWTINNKEN
jgi:rhamnogalacturonan endolyase